MKIALFAFFLISTICLASENGLNKCTAVAPSRDGLKSAALWVAHSGKYISYTQGDKRWSGITGKKCPHSAVPEYADCSAFVTWLYWSAFGNGKDYINEENWSAGYTGTMASHGEEVSKDKALPGDVVLYGKPTISHATMYVGDDQVVGFGEDGPAYLRKIDYRDDLNQIRTYKSFFSEENKSQGGNKDKVVYAGDTGDRGDNKEDHLLLNSF